MSKISHPVTSTASATAQALQVAGTVSVPVNVSSIDVTNPTYGEPCTADDGYDDIGAGVQVVVTDEAGTTLGVADLGAGTWVAPTDSAVSVGRCQFQFSVTGVAPGQKFYGVHVGNQARGVLRYTQEQVTRPLSLTLG